MSRALGERGDMLPAETSTLVGRRDELAQLRRLLGTARLVTLFGPGGIGKTRLALRSARELRRTFSDGVWFADLTTVDSEDGVLDAVATEFAVGSGADGTAHAVLELFAERHALIVLDNCEHVIASTSKLAEELLRAAPQVRIIATSREVLGIHGEVIMNVPTLSFPSGAQAGGETTDAVALFEQRVAFRNPDRVVAAEDRAVIGEICRRLEGVPLAIELAAARVRVLSLSQILKRLDDPYRLLTGGSRTAPERHQTLLSSARTSAELCTTLERTLWGRMAVFVGGWDLAAAEYAADDLLDKDSVVDLVQALIDKSIVVRTGDDHPRYRMLETIRGYGLQVLLPAAQAEDARRRHCDWCLGVMAAADQHWLGNDQADWLDRLDLELPNLRAATEFALHAHDIETALELIVPAWRPCWLALGRLAEMEHWLDRALAQPGEASTLRTRAHLVRSFLAWKHQDRDKALADLVVAEQLLETSADPDNVARLKFMQATVTGVTSDTVAACEAALTTLEHAHSLIDCPAGSRDRCAATRLHLLVSLAVLAELAGETTVAARRRDEALALMSGWGEKFEQSYLLLQTGLATLQHGGIASARNWLRRSLVLKRELGDRVGVTLAVQAIAAVELESGQADRAAELLGCADALWHNAGAVPESVPVHIQLRRVTEDRTREALGPATYQTRYDRGAQRDPVSALAWSLGEKVGSNSRNLGAGAVLSRREAEVAELVAQGMTNRDIAARLVVAQRTAEGHVERILVKLGFTSRSQIATWVSEQR